MGDGVHECGGCAAGMEVGISGLKGYLGWVNGRVCLVRACGVRDQVNVCRKLRSTNKSTGVSLAICSKARHSGEPRKSPLRRMKSFKGSKAFRPEQFEQMPLLFRSDRLGIFFLSLDVHRLSINKYNVRFVHILILQVRMSASLRGMASATSKDDPSAHRTYF